jgi:nickel/cobalt homeostasis protein
VEITMRRTHAVLLSAGLFLGSLTLTPAALAEGEQTDNVPTPPQVEQTAPDAQVQTPVADAQAAVAPAQPQDNAAQPAAPNNYDLTTIVIDYKEYKVGDVVPDQYRGKSYIIAEWQPRHLPAPQDNTHWAYINANYILITNDTGKIVMGKSGDIFFKG